MRAFIAQSGIDEMDLVNDGEVHTINMPGKRKKKALAFKIVARPTATTISTLLELTKKGYSREALELTVNGTKKHFWVVLGLPGASNGGSAAPVFRIKFRAKKTEVDFMQLMVDLRINWYLFRVGNPFSIDSFYPLSGPANDIAFCVFESKDYGSLAKLALGKDNGVLSVRLVTPMHLPMYAPPLLPAATAATAASSGKGRTALVVHQSAGGGAGGASAQVLQRHPECVEPGDYYWRPQSEVNERFRDGKHGVVLFGLKSRADSLGDVNAFLKKKLGAWGQLGSLGLGEFSAKFGDTCQIVWDGIKWDKIVQIVDMVVDLKRTDAIMGGGPPSGLSLQMNMEYKEAYGLGCRRCMEIGHTADSCKRDVGRCTDVPHGHAGACHVRLLRSPGVLLPQGRHSEADLPRPFRHHPPSVHRHALLCGGGQDLHAMVSDGRPADGERREGGNRA